MKYIVFIFMLLAGIPAMVWMGITYRRGREALISLLIASTCFGSLSKVNFLSVETYRGPDRGFEVTLTDLIAVAINIVLLLKFSGKLKWLPKSSGLLALLFLVGVVSLWNADVPLYAGFTLFKLLRMYNLFWCIVNVLEVGVRLETVWRGYIVVGILMTWLAIKQRYLNGMYRIVGPFDAPNSVPLYINVHLPLLLSWALADKRLTLRQAILTVSCVFGMLFSVIATASRAGIFLSVFSLVLVCFITTVRTPSRRSVVASMVILVLLVAGGLKSAGSIANRLRNAPASSEEARIEFNRAAHAMLHDHPLGVGLNNFSWELTYHAEYRRFLEVTANEREAGVCHHIYNLTAAELGWPGLALYVAVMLTFLWTAIRASLLGKDLTSQLLLGLLLGALSLHLQGFLEWAFRVTPVMQNFTICSGLIVGLGARELSKRRVSGKRQNGGRGDRDTLRDTVPKRYTRELELS
jgi:hypothetical protein